MNRKKGIRNFLKSMKFRLICLFMLIGILTGILIRTGILTAYEKHAVSNRSVDVIGQAKILANQMVSTDYINGAESESITSQLQQMSRIYDGRILLIDSSFHIIKDTYDLDTDKTIISEEVIKSFRGEDSMNYDVDNHYVEMTIPLTTDNVESGEKSIIGVLLISVSTDSILANLEYMRNAALVLQIFGAVLLFAVSVFLSVRLTNPLKNMASSIAEIQNGYGTSDGELMIKDYSETVQISEKFNKLYSRMKMLDDSRQEFVSNVSHELKTPIALIQGYAEGLTEGMCEDEESRNYYCEVIMDEANKMNKMVKQLLTLSSLESGSDRTVMERFDLTELIQGVINSARIMVQQAEAEVKFECSGPVWVWADEFKIEEVVTNYLSNAIHHAGGEKKIVIRITRDGDKVRVSVFNTGTPIPEEALPNLWMKFYKVDKARTREYGGTGIGLSIVKAIMDAHHESCGVENWENGVEFWFTLDGSSQ